MEQNNVKNVETGTTSNKAVTVIGIILILIMIPVLIFNMTLIIKGTMNDAMPPDILGVTPLVVLSGSMDDGSEGAISAGDLILVKGTDANNLKKGDIVAFMESGYAVTHRVIAVNEADDGSVTYTTRGDANNVEDKIQLKPENVIGSYFYRIPKIGDFILYLQTPTGMILFIGLPILLILGFDAIRRNMFTKSEMAKQEQLKKELEELKRQAEQNSAE